MMSRFMIDWLMSIWFLFWVPFNVLDLYALKPLIEKDSPVES